MRDQQLDNYRALVMMYLFFIHVAYWLHDIHEPCLSLVLFVMPMVFFVSGASLAVAVAGRGLLSTVKGRLIRVVLPFYVYAAVVIALFTAATLILPDTTAYGFRPFSVASYGWSEVLSVILCADVPGVPNNAHLWFIVPYLILSCTFPMQSRLMRRVNRHVYMGGCLLLFAAVQSVTRCELLREVLCYNVFMVGGYLYYRRAGAGARLLAAAASLACMCAHVMSGGDFVPLQAHKFPPDWLYVSYGIFVLCLLSLAVGRVTIPSNRLLRLWNRRGYTIYLYQSIVFLLVPLIGWRPLSWLPVNLVWLSDTLLAIALSTVLVQVTYPLERCVLGRIGGK